MCHHILLGKKKGERMVCEKCGFGHMIDDTLHEVEVYKCWVCGNRSYVGHPRRHGSLVCDRCGDDLPEGNRESYCTECLRLAMLNTQHLKNRTYGETVCACGTTFIKRGPTQLFHSRTCRQRFALLGQVV
jgi:hypothetical protein